MCHRPDAGRLERSAGPRSRVDLPDSCASQARRIGIAKRSGVREPAYEVEGMSPRKRGRCALAAASLETPLQPAARLPHVGHERATARGAKARRFTHAPGSELLQLQLARAMSVP